MIPHIMRAAKATKANTANLTKLSNSTQALFVSLNPAKHAEHKLELEQVAHPVEQAIQVLPWRKNPEVQTQAPLLTEGIKFGSQLLQTVEL